MAKKQTELKGIEAPSIPEIDEAAELYVEYRDKRTEFQEKEKDAKEKLQALMEAKKLKTYRFDDNIVELTGTTKLKVKRAGEETEEYVD